MRCAWQYLALATPCLWSLPPLLALCSISKSSAICCCSGGWVGVLCSQVSHVAASRHVLQPVVHPHVCVEQCPLNTVLSGGRVHGQCQPRSHHECAPHARTGVGSSLYDYAHAGTAEAPAEHEAGRCGVHLRPLRLPASLRCAASQPASHSPCTLPRTDVVGPDFPLPFPSQSQVGRRIIISQTTP